MGKMIAVLDIFTFELEKTEKIIQFIRNYPFL